jgi:hypothetical protein
VGRVRPTLILPSQREVVTTLRAITNDGIE